jgi:hypothetical protein
MRIDHIFLSTQFSAQAVMVPRSDLTRVTSDHLPLLADLQLAPLPAETSAAPAAARPENISLSPISATK